MVTRVSVAGCRDPVAGSDPSPTTGTLGDRIGRRKLLLVGAVAFGLASVTAAYSTSPAMLIAARTVLGVAGAILAPSTISLIRTLFRDPRQMGLANGLWGLCVSAGAVIGPVVGGAMLTHYLVGLGLPARRAGDGGAARGRSAPAARVPRPASGEAGSHRRGAVATASPEKAGSAAVLIVRLLRAGRPTASTQDGERDRGDDHEGHAPVRQS
jgi:MFS family permease